MNQDQIKNVAFTLQAIEVVPSDTEDILDANGNPTPGQIFLDSTGTEGAVKVDLVGGGTLILTLAKETPHALCPIVKKVYVTGTDAEGIFVNPIAQ